MVKMVVFDLDGTLINSLTDLAISVNYGLKLNGLEEKPVENYKTYVGNGREMLIRRAMGDAWTDHELFEKVKADYDRHYAVHCNDHTSAYDGCAEMLEKLAKKGLKTGVLSNKPDEFVDKMLKKAFPNHRFTQAWGQKPQYKTKPEPDALLALLDMSGVTPEECFYVGDSDVGRGVNFGCGCVTANYDGINKFRTKIGDHAFIGCNTNLIAPVEVGENATTAAGSTVTKNVPANSLAVERGQMRVIENWGKNALRKKK